MVVLHGKAATLAQNSSIAPIRSMPITHHCFLVFRGTKVILSVVKYEHFHTRSQHLVFSVTAWHWLQTLFLPQDLICGIHERPRYQQKELLSWKQLISKQNSACVQHSFMSRCLRNHGFVFSSYLITIPVCSRQTSGIILTFIHGRNYIFKAHHSEGIIRLTVSFKNQTGI